MASLLRTIVAGPRARHPEAGLDLCYVTDNIIATSGPSSTFPQRAYRNPTDALVKFLDYKHGENWSIWEFRAEASPTTLEPGASAVIFRPAKPIILPTSDINIDFERRNRAAYGFTMVTSVAHVWFNAFFESQHSSSSSQDSVGAATEKTGPPDESTVPDSGIFEIDWEAMDGIKGSASKGTRALDLLAVVWRAIDNDKDGLAKIITEPAKGESIPQSKPADWTNANKDSEASLGKDLGLRTESPTSATVSKASSATDLSGLGGRATDNDSEAGIRSHGPDGEERIQHPDQPNVFIPEPASMNHSKPRDQIDGVDVDQRTEKFQSHSHSPDISQKVGLGEKAGVVDQMKMATMNDLPSSEEHVPGQIVKEESEPPAT
ncbi:hypothetical protein P7C71_g705, partial [Lecanoromycetidae sp. Uapishka_2]